MMSKETIDMLTASDRLNQALTAAVIEAGKVLDKDQVLAVLNRLVEMIENGD
jgi:hypothetical protein